MTTHRAPHPGDQESSELRPEALAEGSSTYAEEKAVIDHRDNERAHGGMRPASAHSTSSGDRMLRIRRRVAEGAYDNAAVVAMVARVLLDSGDLR